MGEAGARSLVLDAGALIAFERADRLARSLVKEAVDRGSPILVPAAVLAQVWRDGRRQARLARLIASETTEIDVLDGDTAKAVGTVCGRSGTSDVVDGSVVLSASLHGAIVLTGDAADLLRIDPSLDVRTV